jgi:hypothetical protein
MSTDNEREPDAGANPDEYISDGRTGESYVLGQTFDAKPVAMLDASSGDDIRRLTRTKLSAVPVTEPGADPADVAGRGEPHRPGSPRDRVQAVITAFESGFIR